MLIPKNTTLLNQRKLVGNSIGQYKTPEEGSALQAQRFNSNELYTALYNSDIQKSTTLLADGALIEDFSKELYTPYGYFFINQDDIMVRYLSSIGIDINFSPARDRNLLSYLVNQQYREDAYPFQFNQQALIDKLVEMGKRNYDFVNNSSINKNENALYRLLQKHQIRAARTLFKLGVPVEDKKGSSSALSLISSSSTLKHLFFALELVEKSILFDKKKSLTKNEFGTLLIELNNYSFDQFSGEFQTLSELLKSGTTPFDFYISCNTFLLEHKMFELQKKLHHFMVNFIPKEYTLDLLTPYISSRTIIDLILTAFPHSTPFELLPHIKSDSLKAYLFTKTVGGAL